MKALKILLPIIIVIIIVLVIIGVRKNKIGTPDPETPLEQETIVASIVNPTLVPINEDSYLFGISGSYPKFSQADDIFNKKIADAVMAGVSDFKDNANADYKAHVELEGDAFTDRFTKGDYYYYQIKTEIVQSTTSFISVRISYAGFTGGAHPFRGFMTFNYDVQNKKELDLSYFYPGDADYLKKIADTARTQLAVSLAKASEQTTLDSTIKSMMMDGTDPAKVENFRNFTFTDNVITIYFGEYQVAPYVYGEQKIEIAINSIVM